MNPHREPDTFQDPLLKVICVIPVYNNKGTLKQVAMDCLAYVEHVLVVDDGCTDVDVAELFSETEVEVVRHAENRGKGEALLTGLRVLASKEADTMLVLDADGQHKAEDIPKFLALIRRNPKEIIVGARDFTVDNIPKSSRFGRAFSNFWVKLETGVSLGDSQSGFRAYPVNLLTKMNLSSHHYDFEIEVLVKAIWHGLSIQEVDITTWYATQEERITWFDPWKDNLRLTGMHTQLIGRRLCPWPYKKLVQRPASARNALFQDPKAFLLHLLKENSTPLELGVAAGVGVFLATLPLIAMHTIIILYVTARLNLNRIMAVSIQNICAPPIVPVACIALGHFMRGGPWVVPTKTTEIFRNLHMYLGNWLLGSLILAPVLGLLIGCVTYYLANYIVMKRQLDAERCG